MPVLHSDSLRGPLSKRTTKRRKPDTDEPRPHTLQQWIRSRAVQWSLAAVAICCGVGIGIWVYSGSEPPHPPANQPLNPTQADVAAQLARLDPRLDGWDTEAFDTSAGGQLKKIGKLLADPAAINAETIAHLASDDFTCGSLRPEALKPCFTDRWLRVSRPEPGPTSEPAIPTRSLAEALRTLAKPLEGVAELHVKFKTISVSPEESGVATVSYYQAGGSGPRGGVQQSSTWRCRWTHPSSDAPPRLRSIEVEGYEEVVSTLPRPFADCTAAVLGGNSSFGQMLQGIDHWRSRLPKWTGTHYTGHHGLAVGDVNGDGLDDVYVCRTGGVPNRLFVHQRDGTATDTSHLAGVDWLDYTSSALFLDLDNDGDQDLALAMAWGVVMMSNDGSGNFIKAAAVPVFQAMTSMCAADYDLDGKLDLYVCVNGGREGRDTSPIPYHDANNGGRNVLLRNLGGWQFTDVTDAVGLDENNRRFSFAAAWEDYDRDGDLDLYVANDYGRNNLYQNTGGRFRDVAATAGVEDISAGMSVDWADYNGDGLLDLYVSNMFSAAGNRVTYQRRFRPDELPGVRSQFQRHARGNSLFENRGDGTFRDVSVEAGVTMGRWAWGSNFVDLNNDGREDLFIANGYVTQEDTDDL